MSYIIEGKTGKWEVVIGLEVHCQLKTESKLFSRSSTEFGKKQNTNVSFYDAAMPGQLPVLNENAVRQAVKTGLGLNAHFNLKSVFDRKNYFYADLPSGYQITQFFYPIIKDGWLEIEDETNTCKKIGIREAHIEQDAAKLLHDQHPLYSFLDLNRSGVCLLEIVSQPDLRSPEEAMSYLRKLRALVRALDTCDGNMDEGSMRCDANVSVMPLGSKVFGTRCEIKNVNSIKNVGIAITYEAHRQVELLEQNIKIKQETRKFNALTGTTSSMRSKEDTVDYRYFPDPDLAPLIIDEAFIEDVRSEMPELPDVKKRRYIETLGLSDYDATVLTSSKDVSNFFEKLIQKHSVKLSTTWLTSELFGRLNKMAISIAQSPVTAEMLIELLDLMVEDTISGKIAKEVLDIMLETGQSAKQIVEERGLKQDSNEEEINKLIDDIIQNNAKQVAEYKGGNERIFGFFVGQVMKASQGKINPKMANDLLKKRLN